MASYTVKELAHKIQATLHGTVEASITGVGTLEAGQSGQIGFLADGRYGKFLPSTRLSALIVAEPVASFDGVQLQVADVKRAWRQVVALFALDNRLSGVAVSAVVDSSAVLGEGVGIGAGAIIGAGAVIGAHCQIGAGVVIGEEVSIGAHSVIVSGAKILARSVIGRNAYIDAGAVIGSRGFGFSFEEGRWLPIAQVGRVIIGDEVEVGANTTIDCGAVGDTVIGDGVKLDNQIQVAHNVIIGEHTIIAGCCVIAGSTKIGRYCLIGGASVLNGHIQIADKVQITGHSSVSKSITQAGAYSSAFPAMPNREWNRLVANARRLDKKN